MYPTSFRCRHLSKTETGNHRFLRELRFIFGEKTSRFREIHHKRGDDLLATVHTWLNLKKNEKGLTLGRIEQSLSIKHPELSMSDTKLSRIFKDPKTKISMEELFALVDCMELNKQEIMAIIGEQEYRAAQVVDYKGTNELIAEFERREAAMRADHDAQIIKATAIREGMQRAFEAAEEAFRVAVETISRHRDEELQNRERLQGEVVLQLQQHLADEHERVAAIRKSLKWWRAAAVIGYGILAGAFVYILWELVNLDKGVTAVLIRMVRDGLL